MLPWISALAIFMLSLDVTILNTALPTIAKALNHPVLEMQTVVVFYSLVLAIFIPISSWLSDRYGTKKVFFLATLLFSLGSFLCNLSSSFLELIIFRIIQAIGGSMMLPISRLILLYSYPKKQLLKIMNFVLIPGLLGPILGPLLGGWLVEVASWHWIFLINIPIGFTSLLLTLKIMPDFKHKTYNFDLIGFILFGSSLVTLSLAFELGQLIAFSKIHFIILLLSAAILSSIYVIYSKKVKNPIIDISILKNRTLKIGILGNLLTGIGVGSIPYLFPQLLQIVFMHTPTQSGMILMFSGISTVSIKPLVVPIVRKFGYKNVLIVNTILLSLTISMFAFPEKETPLYLLIPILLLYGAINSIETSTTSTISLSKLNSDIASNGNSLLSITQLLSMSFGVSIGSSILRIIRHSKIIDADLKESFQITFIVLGLFTLLSSIIFFFLHKDDGDNMSGRKEEQIIND